MVPIVGLPTTKEPPMKRLAVTAIAALTTAAALLATASTAHALVPNQTDPQKLMAVLRPQLDAFWAPVVGENFQAPGFKWYAAPATVCGTRITGPNSFFCPADNTIYLDYNWHRELIRRRGDFASAFVYAHEYGHAVQL